MTLQPEDLSPLEMSFLGVLCVGLPPSRVAGDDRFRVDHVTASVYGLLTESRREVFLGPDAVAVLAGFRQDLRAAVESLIARGIVARQPAGMPAAAGGYEGLAVDLVNPDEHPALLDHYLGQSCMEKLFRVPAVYPYLMERYTASGEVWRRVRAADYLTA